MVEFRIFILVSTIISLEFITVDLEGVVDVPVIRCDSSYFRCNCNVLLSELTVLLIHWMKRKYIVQSDEAKWIIL